MKKRYPIKKKAKKIRPIFWSSLVFTTNMTHAFLSGLYLYSFCFACVTITSLVVHTEYNIYTSIIDRLAIASIVIYGGYRGWNRMDGSFRTWMILLLCAITFIITIWIYVYITFLSNHNSLYHVCMHCISSLGHHAILLL